MNWRTTRPGGGWIEGLAGKDGVKGGQERVALLAQALILGFELGNPVVGRHVSMLHPLCKSD